MVERLRAPVAVAAFFDHRTRQTRITRLTYDGRDFVIKSISYHFTQRKGRTLLHVFNLAGQVDCFRVVFNTDSLSWILEEIHFHGVASNVNVEWSDP